MMSFQKAGLEIFAKNLAKGGCVSLATVDKIYDEITRSEIWKLSWEMAQKAMNEIICDALEEEGIEIPEFVLEWVEDVLWHVFEHYTAGHDDDNYKRVCWEVINHACYVSEEVMRYYHIAK